MLSQLKPPFRAEHIGSLLRPKALLDQRAKFARGEIDQATLTKAEDQAIKDALALQERVGLKFATDGEFRRRSWFAGFVDAVAGLTHKDTEFNFMEEGEAAISVPVPHAEAPIRRTKGLSCG